jgi:leader peptidase (prepilin peptidase)/N-methyltransferase
MIRILGTIFAGLLGLAFGSFLNVCLSRWPAGESIVHPRSHCRNCDHKLAWWENIPLLSWLLLRGRCRNCHTAISWRYPLVELIISALWSFQAWSYFTGLSPDYLTWLFGHLVKHPEVLFFDVGWAIFPLLLTTLAVLDAENLWLPDWLTLPGTLLGAICTVLKARALFEFERPNPPLTLGVFDCLIAIFAAAALILLIRWLYKLIRHREGIGLGDAKLMALLAAWLGLPGAMLAFCIGAILGAVAALVLLASPSMRNQSETLATTKLPLGTFLCIGGIVSSLWGRQILDAYLRYSGL